MANQVIPTAKFENQYKRLKKKFKTLDNTIYELENQLIQNPYLGKRLNQNIFKIRISDPSKGKGKSGGFRVITYIVEETSDLTSVFMINQNKPVPRHQI